MLNLASNKVNILGTEYTIIFRDIQEDELAQQLNAEGYTSDFLKQIVLINRKSYNYPEGPEAYEEREKSNLRHELVHAFLKESGLACCSFPFPGPWTANEEMVDWIAQQGPKIYVIYKELELI